jgi:hypothetical protein
MYLAKFFHSETGKHMLSIILGLGLASLFRTVCKDKNCMIFKAPPLEEIKDKVYKYNDKCYAYNPVATKCDAGKKIVEFA